MSGRVEGKVIVVTGAGRGQGAAEAERLAAEGATVLAGDVSTGDTAPVQHGSVHPHRLDVADPQSWLELRDRLEREFGGRVDGLINNAGVDSRVRLPEVSLTEWNRVLGVNLTGPMLGIQTLLPLLSDGASIVNVGSIAALTAYHAAAYTTSKWGLRGLTRLAAVELGNRGIRVNAVHPGYIETPMTATAPAPFLRANIELTPLARSGRPEEVAELMVFLMSDESRFITGTEITVDGGQVAGGISKFLSDATADQAEVQQ